MNGGTTERWSYYQLMGSLPPLPPTFEVNRHPISGARLEERLSMMPDGDREVVEMLRDMLFWERQHLEMLDIEFATRYEQFIDEFDNPTVREVAEFRMDVRTLIAAVRRRRRDMSPPSGVGQWVSTIRRNWQDPGFGLSARFPWILRLDRHLQAGEVAEANHLILDVVYKQWSAMAARHFFNFEAVVLYVARWDVIDRWVSRNADVGHERLERLVSEAIGDYDRLF